MMLHPAEGLLGIQMPPREPARGMGKQGVDRLGCQRHCPPRVPPGPGSQLALQKDTCLWNWVQSQVQPLIAT